MNTKNFENTMRKVELDHALEVMMEALRKSVEIAEKHALTSENIYYRKTKCVLDALDSWEDLGPNYESEFVQAAEAFGDAHDDGELGHIHAYNEFIVNIETNFTFEKWASMVEQMADEHDWAWEHSVEQWEHKVFVAKRSQRRWFFDAADPRRPVIEVMQNEDPFRMDRLGALDWQHGGFVAHPPF